MRALAFTSGMAALAACLRLAPPGSHVVAGDDLYGGTSRLLARVAPDCGLEVTLVDTAGDVANFQAALRPGKTALVLLESPTNPAHASGGHPGPHGRRPSRGRHLCARQLHHDVPCTSGRWRWGRTCR